ncbi:MAG: benzoate/H(+) symporter BenE family transporter [Rhodovarius sp.]|nr:benzoate/H(+) symporter BenE family transporter [Rhodovarius sp.]
MIPPILLGLLAACVGFTSTFAVVLAGLAQMGASPEQAASGLFAVTLAMGLLGVLLSFRLRMPVSIAWSTPGAALLAASAAPSGGFPAAVGAFLFASALLGLAGLWRPLARAVAAVPGPVAHAMLAGVLLDLCLAPARAVAEIPWLALPVVVLWLVMLRLARLWAVPAAVALSVVLILLAAPPAPGWAAGFGPAPVLVLPAFDAAALIGIGLPLFLVTMASQNVPGLAVLAANGYRIEPGPIFLATGAASAASAALGGHLVNLAAITAALCAGPEAGADPARRWIAGAVAGLTYVVFALLAGAAAALAAAAPPLLIQAVAGLALMTSLVSALRGSLEAETLRLPAVLCFVITASGLSLGGIGAAFWGLSVGLAAARLLRGGG